MYDPPATISDVSPVPARKRGFWWWSVWCSLAGLAILPPLLIHLGRREWRKMAERLLTETNHEISAEAVHQARLSINHGVAHAIAAAVIAGLALLWFVIAITCHLRQPKVVPED